MSDQTIKSTRSHTGPRDSIFVGMGYVQPKLPKNERNVPRNPLVR